jgi:hypothetical protein
VIYEPAVAEGAAVLGTVPEGSVVPEGRLIVNMFVWLEIKIPLVRVKPPVLLISPVPRVIGKPN